MPEKAIYDIAVIGGGLAGLCLSLQAAEKGYSVILFEKEEYPFHKVCGEYISLESYDFLKGLGVPLEQWEVPIIKRFQSSDAKGNLYNFNLPLGGFGVSRYKLDDCLYKLALAKGVHVHNQTRVNNAMLNPNDIFTVQTSKGDFQARIAAGTFGKRSNLDVKWNRDFIQKKYGKLNNYIGVKYHIHYPHAPDTIALHNFKNGYCGISNIEGGKTCLCYLTTAQNLLQSGNSIRYMEENILSKNPFLKKIFSEAVFLYEKPLTISQVSFSNKTQVETNILLMGDAAGMIPPLCGNGMSMAMHGSKIAFICIEQYLQMSISRIQLEKAYIRLWKKEFSRRIWVGQKVQQLFGGNTSTSLFLKSMKALPFLATRVIRSTHGKPF